MSNTTLASTGKRRSKEPTAWALCKIVTDQLRNYPAAKADIPELANTKRVFVKASARVDSRAKNGHQPTLELDRYIKGFRDPARPPGTSCRAFQHFALKRRLLRTSHYRKRLAARFFR